MASMIKVSRKAVVGLFDSFANALTKSAKLASRKCMRLFSAIYKTANSFAKVYPRCKYKACFLHIIQVNRRLKC